MSNVKLISHTTGAGELEGKSPQDVISYVARVSNPHNQDSFHTSGGLLKYCIKHQHWSIFETAGMTLEINTNRGIAAQVLRHRSFTFQEFSQRYADTKLLDHELNVPELRRQDKKNRQNSIGDLPPGITKDYEQKIEKHFEDAMFLYDNLLDAGVAKECARFVLHYIELRSANGTQKEHRDLALQCKDIFTEVFPDVAKALEWTE